MYTHTHTQWCYRSVNSSILVVPPVFTVGKRLSPNHIRMLPESEVMGSEVMRSEVMGSEVMGSEVMGSEVMRSEVMGST